MIKEEIVEKISQFFKLSMFEAERVFDDIFSKIMNGVKDDSIIDIVNFGEFIVKLSNDKNGEGLSTPKKRTVEFLASSMLEDEIGHKNYDFLKSQYSASQREIEEPIEQPEKTTLKAEIPSIPKSEAPFEEEKPIIPNIVTPLITPEKPSVPINEEIESNIKPSIVPDNILPRVESTPLSIEEEFKRKREALLSKISIHPLQDADTVKKPELSKPLQYNFPISDATETKDLKVEQESEKQEIPPIKEDIQEKKEEIISKIGEIPISEKEEMIKPEEEDLSKKSFSDYFTEVKGAVENEQTPISKTVEPPSVTPVAVPTLVTPVIEPTPEVLPKEAVELHQQIVQAPPVVEQTEPKPIEQLETSAEHKTEDKSYYIWYKESEPNVADTQTMSYEYELLYQATKEAEYKSKLKIYVTSFILFFSLVLALLIFSPVIYKLFFTPEEQQSNEYIEQGSNEQNTDQKAILNLPPGIQNDSTKPKTDTALAQQQAQNETQQTTQQTAQQTENNKPENQQSTTQQNQPPSQQTQQPSETKIEGVTKSSVGWVDDKYKVVYIQLDNGKYSIQESSWNSEDKVNKRISEIEALKIPGLKGSFAKVDLGDKGVWYRTRFGEFGTIQEARSKAEELRSKLK